MQIEDFSTVANARSLTRLTYALILAGGRGSRLGQLTDWRSKPSMPFGGQFRLIDFPLSNCVNSGIRRIGIATQYKSQCLIGHVQRGWNFLEGRLGEFVDILPAQQRVAEDWYRGTADAVFQNEDLIRAHQPEYVLILAGDHVYRMDYSRMLADHVARGAEVSVACLTVPRQDASAFGVLQVDTNQKVIAFEEKPAHPATLPDQPQLSLASMGIYIFNTRTLFDVLHKDAMNPHSHHDFGRDLLPLLVGDGRVHAHRFSDSCVGGPYWKDVGTVDSYWSASIQLTDIIPELNLYDQDWPIWTHVEQAPPAKFVLAEKGCSGKAVDSLVSNGCIVSGGSVRRSLLFPGARVNERARVTETVVLPGASVGKGCRIRRAVIDSGCRIPDGLRIGYDLEHDRRHFHVTEQGVVLVTSAMLERYSP